MFITMFETDQEKAYKFYNYCYGTEYYIIDRKNTAVTYDISYDGKQFTFTPSELIPGLCDGAFSTSSLLAGTTKIMAEWTSYCLKYTNEKHENPENRFQLSTTVNRGYTFTRFYSANVDMYIDFTHNMILDTEDDKEYQPIMNYIFPNKRRPNNGKWTDEEWLPKDLIKIRYYDNVATDTSYDIYSPPSVYYKIFLSAFDKKNELLLNKLNCLKIRDQIDVPTKLVVFGVCNKFGKDNENKRGIVSILYINHKISMANYTEFKTQCNKELDECLKPFGKTYEYILNMTKEKAEKDFDTFKSIDKFARACGYLRDPRKYTKEKDNYGFNKKRSYIYDNDNEYNNESGLSRWGGIKTYYPELYNGLQIILNRYKELKEEYSNEINRQFNDRYTELANKKYEYYISSDDNNFNENKLLILKYIKKTLDNIEQPIKIDTVEDLLNTIDMLSQDILDNLGEVYQNIFRKRVIEYANQHPRSKKMEIVLDNDIFTGGYTLTLRSLLTFKPFKNLPDNVLELLNSTDFLKIIVSALNKFEVYQNVQPNFYLDGKKCEYRTNKDGLKIYRIEDINKAINHLTFRYEHTEFENSSKHIKNLVITRDLSQCLPERQSIVSVQDFENIIESILSSPFRIICNWKKGSLKTPVVFEPIYDLGTKFNAYTDYKGSKYDSNDTFENILKLNNLNSDTVSNFMNFYISFEFENPQLIIENIKKTECFKRL